MNGNADGRGGLGSSREYKRLRVVRLNLFLVINFLEISENQNINTI